MPLSSVAPTLKWSPNQKKDGVSCVRLVTWSTSLIVLLVLFVSQPSYCWHPWCLSTVLLAVTGFNAVVDFPAYACFRICWWSYMYCILLVPVQYYCSHLYRLSWRWYWCWRPVVDWLPYFSFLPAIAGVPNVSGISAVAGIPTVAGILIPDVTGNLAIVGIPTFTSIRCNLCPYFC